MNMKPKVIYATVDKRARIESASLQFDQFEEPDGDHLITSDSVWQDAKRMRPPIVLFMQNVFLAYGSTAGRQQIYTGIYQMKADEINSRPASVSKMNWRVLEQLFDWLRENLFYIFVIALVAYAIIPSLINGGV